MSNRESANSERGKHASFDRNTGEVHGSGSGAGGGGNPDEDYDSDPNSGGGAKPSGSAPGARAPEPLARAAAFRPPLSAQDA